jgi:hypothetical protein
LEGLGGVAWGGGEGVGSQRGFSKPPSRRDVSPIPLPKAAMVSSGDALSRPDPVEARAASSYCSASASGDWSRTSMPRIRGGLAGNAGWG